MKSLMKLRIYLHSFLQWNSQGLLEGNPTLTHIVWYWKHYKPLSFSFCVSTKNSKMWTVLPSSTAGQSSSSWSTPAVSSASPGGCFGDSLVAFSVQVVSSQVSLHFWKIWRLIGGGLGPHPLFQCRVLGFLLMVFISLIAAALRYLVRNFNLILSLTRLHILPSFCSFVALPHCRHG
jgi:hypothetical protein